MMLLPLDHFRARTLLLEVNLSADHRDTKAAFADAHRKEGLSHHPWISEIGRIYAVKGIFSGVMRALVRSSRCMTPGKERYNNALYAFICPMRNCFGNA